MNEKPQTVPADTIYVMPLPGADPSVIKRIRPARPTRQWMDRTPNRYAYRCIPLGAANTMGWEILNPVACEFYWSGMTDHRRMHVWTPRPDHWAPHSHFGSGVITWQLPFLFRTPPDYGLAITGPANHDKAGIVPLDGFVRTDWLPYPFTMNWRITEARTTIRFEEGEAIGRIFPYPLGVLDEFRIEARSLKEDPALHARFQEWIKTRREGYESRSRAEEELAKTGKMPDFNVLWPRRYTRGTGSDAAEREHQTVFRVKEIEDQREPDS